MTLYEELVEYLDDFHLKIEDIQWVGTYSYEIDKEEFFELAKHTRYNKIFGNQGIACDLLIVGDDWWLEREWKEDSKEQFKIYAMPIKPKKFRCGVHSLCSRTGFETLKEINNL